MKATAFLRLRMFFFFTVMFCASAHAADIRGKVLDDRGNGVAQAVVYVQAPSPEKAPASPTRKASLDQVNKQFVPNLLVIPVGTEVQFPNRDQIHHNVYSLSRTKKFDLKLYKGETIPSITFDQPGVVNIACNIHDEMVATILVVPTPYHATTDKLGEFVLSGVPPGSYTIVVWHERSRAEVAGTAQQVQAQGAPSLTFRLSLKPLQARPTTIRQREY